MKIILTVILGLLFSTNLGHAQEDNVITAASTLQSVLSNLKQSIERLNSDNAQLAQQDQYVKDQVLHLQTQLAQLQAQEDDLNKEAIQLQGNNPHSSQKVMRLEGENSNLDDRIQKTQGDIKAIQQSMDAGNEEEKNLLLQLKGMASAIPMLPKTPSSSPADLQLQKERLKLMKEIYDSQQRQELLHKSVLELQKSNGLQPVGSLAHQQILKEQINNLEEQVQAYQLESKGLMQNAPGVAEQWGNDQLSQLDVELEALGKNYLQLKDLMEKMSKKAQAVEMTASQQNEVKKLQNSMDDLNHQNTQLRADLDALRTQLIELDKRKSYLEMMTQQS